MQPEGWPMRTTILAYVIAIVGLVLIVAGARDIYLLHIEETFDVTLRDYETPIRTIAGGLAMIGLTQALRLLLEISAALRASRLDSSVNSSVILSRLDKLAGRPAG
jgi:hypothetical protein